MSFLDCQVCTDYWNSKDNDVYLSVYLFGDQHIPEAHTYAGFQQQNQGPYPPASGPSVYDDPNTQFNSLYPPPPAPASGPASVYSDPQAQFNSAAAHPTPSASGPDDLQLQTQLNIANAKISKLEAELDDALARGNSLHIQLNARTNITRAQISTFQLGFIG